VTRVIACLGVVAAAVLAAGAGAAGAQTPVPCAGALGIFYYAALDGTVRGLDMNTHAEVVQIPASAFPGTGMQAHEIAFDPAARTLWYAAQGDQIRSFNIDTLAPGPTIAVIEAPVGEGRHIFVDEVRGHIVAAFTNGSLQRYRLSDGAKAGRIPQRLFGGVNAGAFRHIAFDPRTGDFWYARSDGHIIELTGVGRRTGRRIPASRLAGANTGEFRHLVVDPVRNLLLYALSDGSVASIDLGSLQQATHTIPAGSFAGANPGPFRTITYDPQDAGGRLAGPARARKHTEPDRRGTMRVLVRNTSSVPVGSAVTVTGRGFKLRSASFCLSPGQAAVLLIRLLPLPAGDYVGKAVFESTAGQRVKTIRLIRDVS
jgi:hypothetical protein